MRKIFITVGLCLLSLFSVVSGQEWKDYMTPRQNGILDIKAGIIISRVIFKGGYPIKSDSANWLLVDVQGKILKYPVSNFRLKADYDTVPYAFRVGTGLSADTTSFSSSSIYGSFLTTDTMIVTGLNGVMVHGKGNDTLGIQIQWDDSLGAADAIKLRSATIALGRPTGVTTGASYTSFTNSKIPPRVRVWMTIPTIVTAKKPTYLEVTLKYYIKK
jgi:hypothetical protein